MKLAVLGAGFCGLAIAHFAKKKGIDVTIYDPAGVGGGASGVASGLLHPYPGEKARLSEGGLEAFALAKELLTEAGNDVFLEGGIDRYPVSDEQKVLFKKRAQEDPMLEFDGQKLTFLDGITVFARPYLHRLAQGHNVKNEVLTEERFSEYDQVAVAVGASIRKFSFGKDLPLRFIKGQVLRCTRPEWLTRSLVAKGYISLCENKEECIVGSTYEHSFTSEEPDIEEAKKQILPRISKHLPFQLDLNVLGCEAGVRVANVHHYRPIVESVSEQIHILTGMGSRGLLYHALYAQKLVDRL